MTRPSIVSLLALSFASMAPTTLLCAQTRMPSASSSYDLQRYSPNQLDNLVGPVALYPDALLAQLLVASTFPDQVEDAARWVRENGTAGIDDQSWDVSVKAVAHYPSALNMMADKGDWTATLGRAYASQSGDVMVAVQRMRAMADSQGNLSSNQHQQVVRDNDNYVIAPAQPRVIYVPVYDPVVIYTRPVFNVGFSSRYWSYGVGFPIGGWLSYDCDWRTRAVYYNGWDDAYFGYGGGWRGRSRPYVQITNVYVSPRYRNVYVNRNVTNYAVNYRNVDRYVGVHRDVYFDRDGRGNGRNEGRNDGRNDGRNGGRGESRDGRNDGRDNRNDRDRGFPYGSDLGRSAQPRSDRPNATPDGYRSGSTNRDAQQNPRTNQGSTQAAPDRRRTEPSGRAADMSVSPDAIRQARRDRGTGDGAERAERIERPAPRREEQQSAPRQERAREVQSGQAPPPPPQREAQPRQAQPRNNGADRRPPDRNERSSNAGERGARDRRGV